MTTVRYDDPRRKLIGELEELAQQKLPNEAPYIAHLIKHYFLNTSAEDLLSHERSDLYGAMIANWRFIATLQEDAKVRVYNPQFEQHGWQSIHTVIEIVTAQLSFLLESVLMVLTRQGFNVHFILHASLPIVRDKEGHVTAIQEDLSDKKGTPETLLWIEVDRHTNPKVIETLKETLLDAIEDVKLANQDWASMTDRMEEVIALLGQRLEKSSKKEVDEEIISFLKWVKDSHFTFLGYCQQKLVHHKDSSYEWSLDKKTCLGILRKEGDTYFESFQEMSKAAQDLALSKHPIILGKSDRISTVHRPAHTDFIVLKIFDSKERVVGQHQFIGLYTSAAYNRSPQQIPLLRLRVKRILARAQVSTTSHEGKALLNILDTLPRDDFFHGKVEDLYRLSLGILHLQERQRIRLFVLKDPFARLFSCLVFVPRERFNSKLREKIQNILKEELGGYHVDFSTRLSESVLARIHFVIRYKDDSLKEYNVKQIQEKLIQVGRTWEDNLKEAILDHFGEEEGNRLFVQYRRSFPAGYRENGDARMAVYDITHIEKLSDKNALEMSFYRPVDEPDGVIRFKLYSPAVSVPLSDVIPMLECMGLRVISERSHEIQRTNGENAWINDFGMTYHSGKALDVEALRDIFQEAFYHIWYGQAESDGFNRLVLGAALNWREVTMLRAYAKYLWQTGFTFSQAYIEDVLAGAPQIAGNLIALFKTRFSCKEEHTRKATMKELQDTITKDLEEVKNIDEDRILRRYMEVILATIRTNFFQKDKEGKEKDYISFKLNPKGVPELPLPHPMFEIFVYSPTIEGIHLRGAKVARGGIRWSDRREDFRTEVLGLMKTQQVKNAVIVPLGAKGGFVAKNLPQHGSREEIMNTGICAYKTFISGLLDITDNLVENQVVPPLGVIRYDEDDPYLVVAADKGTATFSDIANALSKEYHFWLGDAFASGGSTGYDHKKMAITARGAWESVKQHFKEIGIDTQKTDFTVVGIGDMAGDVFGNGMLLSRKIRLIGAFNHMHIFLDPDPDPEKSYQERTRLFHLPRSTWEDYNPELISKGGGIYARSSKFIPLSQEVQELLGVNKSSMVPNELIQTLLKAKVDLLFNGGIGTYVKATSEYNANVGDKANDALRVNGKDLRCQVVAEGGNLGLTQLGRIEYALNGGRINTDGIDNSGGVDCSDHEVNIKILLNSVVFSGELTEKQRNVLLSEMTEEVAELVLEDNRNQIETISVAEYNATKNVQMHCRLIDHLVKEGNLDREIEFLPTTEELLARQQEEKGLTRPEFAVLLAYCKTLLKSELLASDALEDEYIARDLLTAFPTVLVSRYKKELFSHRLRRELIAMQISNAVINDMGLGFIHRLQDETGASVPEIIQGYVAARDIFKARAFREAVNALNFIVPPEVQVKMLHELNRLVRRGTRWFLRHRIVDGSIEETVQHFSPKMELVRKGLHHAISGTAEEYLVEFANELMGENVPEETALITAQMSAMFSALDIVDAATMHHLPVEAVTITYYAIGARLELGWFREQIKRHPVTNHWDSLARAAFRDDLDRQQRNLTVAVMLREETSDVEAQMEGWMKEHEPLIKRWQQMMADLKTVTKREFTMYAVALRELMELATVSLRQDEKRAA